MSLPALSATVTTRADAIIEVDHVTLRFGGVTSLLDVSLVQRRHEILSVIGPNGAGKTSLFNCVTGVYVPQVGSITFRPEKAHPVAVVGRKPHRVNRLGIARTFQNVRLFQNMSVFDNVAAGLHRSAERGFADILLRSPKFFRQETSSRGQAMELLAAFGLADQAPALAGSLPYGHQRRLEIARALATRPKLLMLDEAMAGLTPFELKEMIGLIRKVRENGVTLVIVEHVMEAVMELSDRVIVINSGRMIVEGTPKEVVVNTEVIQAYLGERYHVGS
jgi:branched-chain amino acid transport system ATP-binding protein